ncbi:MAG TPA: hypothetical protein VN808_13510 [Stellaceae bacterium]|nr:hypothetical protein [Stellaceae bacterium]
MTPHELAERLHALRLPSSDAALFLSVDVKTVKRWLDGVVAIPGPAAQAVLAWSKLERLGLPWRPAEDLLGTNEEEVAKQIRLLREHNLQLNEILQRVRSRGGPAAPWRVDLGSCTAELDGIIEVGFYPLPNGGFSPSNYRRMDRGPDSIRDQPLIEDAIAAIADAVSTAGETWIDR